MFENSFVTRLNLRCPLHYNSKVTHACQKPTCQKPPLLCDECIMNPKIKDQHQGHELQLQRINKYLENIATTIENQKPSIQRLYKSILSQQQNQTLLSWQKEKAQHFQSIQNHLNTLKFQIQEEINNIIVRFQEELNRQKENTYKELESYFQTYRKNFNNFSELTEPVVVMKKQFVYYQSKNNLTLKLMSLEANKINKWLSSFKFNLNRADMASKKQFQYIGRVQNIGLVTNELMDELPRFRQAEFQSELPQILNQSSRNILNSLVSFRRPRIVNQQGQSVPIQPQNHILRSTSMNYISSNEHSRTTSANHISRQQPRQQIRRFPEM